MGIFGKTENKPPEAPPRPVSPPPPSSRPHQPSAPPAPASTRACVIGAKTVVKGDVTGDEDILVEGTVEGTIRITRDLRVGPTGRVKATVSAQSVVVAGEVTGDCHAEQRVHIESTGRLTGNIRAPRVIIVEGATFKGNSDMSPHRGEGRPSGA
jgi:cytoskeletal protein CcmA (bactofilin family)